MEKQVLETARDIINSLLELPDDEFRQNQDEIKEVLEQAGALLSGKAVKDFEKNEIRWKEAKMNAEIAKDIDNFNKLY